MKGAQIGATEIGCNFIGYIMHIAPGPILMVQPTDSSVEKVSKTRIDTLIAACPELSSRVGAPKSRDGKNTINMKLFPGGILILTGANSGAGLRSQPVRYLILDEVDGYPPDVGK
jgi:phage terminase large subunit GpA-like protein